MLNSSYTLSCTNATACTAVRECFQLHGRCCEKAYAECMLNASLVAPVRERYSASALLSAIDFCILLQEKKIVLLLLVLASQNHLLVPRLRWHSGFLDSKRTGILLVCFLKTATLSQYLSCTRPSAGTCCKLDIRSVTRYVQ